MKRIHSIITTIILTILSLPIPCITFQDQFYLNYLPTYTQPLEKIHKIFTNYTRVQQELEEEEEIEILQCESWQKCGRCDNSTLTCTACFEGMVLQGNTCIYTYAIAFCSIYNPNATNLCYQCKFGYYLTYDNLFCKKQVAGSKECHESCRNCVETSTDSIGINGLGTKCLVCEYNYKYNDGYSMDCLSGHSIRYCEFENAVVPNKCDVCTSNFYLNYDASNCIKIGSGSITNCQQFNYTGDGYSCGLCKDCLLCKVTYYMADRRTCNQLMLKSYLFYLIVYTFAAFLVILFLFV